MRELRPDVGVYKIHSKIGSGLTSTVYRAIREDSRGHSKQIVALKILNSRTAVQWLKREFEAITRVNSPYCVKVLAWENSGDNCALVLEYIDGVSLFELAKCRKLPSDLVCEILAQAQEGLRAIAKENLHHGDVSPRNILIDVHGHVKLIDFGTPPDQSSMLHGTPAYIAPEVWCGGEISIESGLFALGLMEIDLQNGFSDAPTAPAAAKRRAFAISIGQSGWLSRQPKDRQFVEMLSEPARRRVLSQIVRDHKAQQNPCLETILEPRQQGADNSGHLLQRLLGRLLEQKSRAAALALFLCLALTAAGQAEAPLRDVSSEVNAEMSTGQVTLEVRSSHWMAISFDGMNVGFTPVRLMHLKRGSHRIGWKTARAEGERVVALRPGETLILRGNDLVRHSSPRR
jgi:serine/threonine protein kinase